MLKRALISPIIFSDTARLFILEYLIFLGRKLLNILTLLYIRKFSTSLFKTNLITEFVVLIKTIYKIRIGKVSFLLYHFVN